ncbi:MAG: hypothetical protein E2P06_08490 [Acidobacteria bacterium]|nr:MAG: hypothetical protein E2P06_08490 [Acidobacteriota bacterium]
MDHLTVPVTGGDLFVARWGSGPPVLAVYGITGSHAAWPWVADRLVGAVSLIAPDLRGRGASNGRPGPFGMAAHAADLVAVLDHMLAAVRGHEACILGACTPGSSLPRDTPTPRCRAKSAPWQRKAGMLDGNTRYTLALWAGRVTLALGVTGACGGAAPDPETMDTSAPAAAVHRDPTLGVVPSAPFKESSPRVAGL